jgi:hypothetical protein
MKKAYDNLRCLQVLPSTTGSMSVIAIYQQLTGGSIF